MTDHPPTGLTKDPTPDIHPETLNLWPRCTHCNVLIDGPRLRPAASEPSPYATSWHADKPDCAQAAEEAVTGVPASGPAECPEHPGTRLIDGSCESRAWHDDHADVFTPSMQAEMDQADDAAHDADELG